jgi:uncharacterized protein YdaU (DUF1376 family)
MAAVPYMPLYIADYLSDTVHLSTQEHGAYLLLLMAYFQGQKPLPSADARLAIITKLPFEEWRNIRSAIAPFFQEVNGRWHHKRVDAEIARFKAKSEKSRQAGVASGKSRREHSHLDSERPLNGRSTDVQRTFNGRSTDVAQNGGFEKSHTRGEKLNGRSADVQRPLNHTDTSTKTEVLVDKGNVLSTEVFPESEVLENQPPENSGDRTAGSFEGSAVWMRDESYSVFVQLYRTFRPRVMDEEFAQGFHWHWAKMDFNQKLLATKNLRSRIDSGEDGEYVKHMPEYLRSEWKREPKPIAAGKSKPPASQQIAKYEQLPGTITGEVFRKMQDDLAKRMAQ